MDRIYDFIFNESFSVIFSLVGYFAFINMVFESNSKNGKIFLSSFLFFLLIFLPYVSYRKIDWSINNLISDDKEKDKQEKDKQEKDMKEEIVRQGKILEEEIAKQEIIREEEKAKQDKNREFKRKHSSKRNKKRIKRGTR